MGYLINAVMVMQFLSSVKLDYVDRAVYCLGKCSDANELVWNLCFHLISEKIYLSKRIIKKNHRILVNFKLQIATEKTSIEKMSGVFSVLGYQIGTKELKISSDSQKRASEQLTQLYSRGHLNSVFVGNILQAVHLGWRNWFYQLCAIKLKLPS